MPGNEKIMEPSAAETAWASIKAIVMVALESMDRLAQGFAPTKRIQSAISHNVTADAGKMYASLEVDVEKAPEAAAYEFGSGMYATRGKVGKYTIEPKEKQALAFHWKNEPPGAASKYHLSDGRIVLPSVQHPGVAAKPFMEPAFDSEEKGKVEQAVIEALGSALSMGPDEITITSEVLIL